MAATSSSTPLQSSSSSNRFVGNVYEASFALSVLLALRSFSCRYFVSKPGSISQISMRLSSSVGSLLLGLNDVVYIVKTSASAAGPWTVCCVLVGSLCCLRFVQSVATVDMQGTSLSSLSGFYATSVSVTLSSVGWLTTHFPSLMRDAALQAKFYMIGAYIRNSFVRHAYFSGAQSAGVGCAGFSLNAGSCWSNEKGKCC